MDQRTQPVGLWPMIHKSVYLPPTRMVFLFGTAMGLNPIEMGVFGVAYLLRKEEGLLTRPIR